MGKELDDLWAAAVKEAGLPYAPSFLNREWEQVILAQDLRTEQEYLTASRAGQGTPLGKAQRRQVWALTQLGRGPAARARPGHVHAARQRGRPRAARRHGEAALPARDHRRGAGPAPRAVAAAARRRARRARRHVHRRRRAPADLRQPRLAGARRRQRPRTQQAPHGQLPHHPGDPRARRPRARQGERDRPGRRGGHAHRLPFPAARPPAEGRRGAHPRGRVRGTRAARDRLARGRHRAARDRRRRPVQLAGEGGRGGARRGGHAHRLAVRQVEQGRPSASAPCTA